MPSPSPTALRQAPQSLEFVASFAPSKGIPKQPARAEIAPGLSLSAGVYILVSQTGGGKSVTAAALVGLANSRGIPASYIYHFEPGASPIPRKGTESGSYFEKETSYLSDLDSFVKDSRAPFALLALDSVTNPLKAHAIGWQGQGTFPGGMQISDRAFLDRLSLWATGRNLCVITVVNSSLIPYASALYGATWGMITVHTLGELTISDRALESSRRNVDYSIPEAAVQTTLSEFGYDSQLRTAASHTRSLEGVDAPVPSRMSTLHTI